MDDSAISKIIYKTLGYVDDDLMQVGRITVWEGEKSFNGEGDIKGYLANKVRFAVIDYLRTQNPAGYKREKKVFVHVPVEDANLEDVETLDDYVELTEILGAPRSLKAQSVLEMTATGHTLEEIGSELGVSYARVSQILSETRKKL